MFWFFAVSEEVEGAVCGGAGSGGFSVSSAAVDAHKSDSFEGCGVCFELLFKGGYAPCPLELIVSGVGFFNFFH